MAKIFSIGNVDDIVINVQQHLQGLIFDEIGLNTTIKVDYVSKTQNGINVIPEMKAKELLDIINSIQGRGGIEKVDAVKIYDFALPFSLGGVLLFDEDNYYKVTIGAIVPDATEIFKMDNSEEGFPIMIKRDDIKASITEKDFNFENFSHLYFLNGNPDLIEFRRKLKNNPKEYRKVSYDSKSIDMQSLENRITRYQTLATVGIADAALPVNNPILGTDKNVFSVKGLSEVTLHKTGGEYIFYKVQA